MWSACIHHVLLDLIDLGVSLIQTFSQVRKLDIQLLRHLNDQHLLLLLEILHSALIGVHRVERNAEVLLCDQVLKNVELFDLQVLEKRHLIQALFHLVSHLLLYFVSKRKLLCFLVRTSDFEHHG